MSGARQEEKPDLITIGVWMMIMFVPGDNVLNKCITLKSICCFKSTKRLQQRMANLSEMG